MKTLLTITALLLSLTVVGQPEKKSVVIGAMTTRPNALLIVNPKNSDQGVLLPQLSTGQRLSVKPSSPHEDGLIVFDRNANAYYYWANGNWIKLKTDEGPRTRYYSIDPIDFQELKPDNLIRHNNMVVFETDNTFVTASRSGLGEAIIAPVNLPHGAILTEMTVFYMDDDDDNIKVELLRKSLDAGTEQILTWESSGMSPLVNSVSFPDFAGKGAIDLANFTYRIIVTFAINDGEEIDTPAEARQRLYAIRIQYQE